MKPYVQTFSVIAGTSACNAKCPYCISKMTPKCGTSGKIAPINESRLNAGARLARDWGATTALITSKGEATLYPDQIATLVQRLASHFPLVELQTNGMKFNEEKFSYFNMGRQYGLLSQWRESGLTTIALSCVGCDHSKNQEIFGDKYVPLTENIKTIHDNGLSVRLTCMFMSGGIDSWGKMLKMIKFCKDNDVEQLTVRKLSHPEETNATDIVDWVDNHQLEIEDYEDIMDGLYEHGTRLMSLVHGGIVYDFEGQNVCFTNCLTESNEDDEDENNIRQLIYFPDGHIRYSWQHKGAIII